MKELASVKQMNLEHLPHSAGLRSDLGVGDTSPVSVSENAPDTVKTKRTDVIEKPEAPNPAEWMPEYEKWNKLRALPVTVQLYCWVRRPFTFTRRVATV